MKSSRTKATSALIAKEKSSRTKTEIEAGLAMRIPRIKFPQRHLKSAGTTSQPEKTFVHDQPDKNDDLVKKFFSRVPTTSAGGKASDQPKRTPVTQEEIEAVMLGGCI